MSTVFLSRGSNSDRQHNIGSGLDDLATAFGELRLSPVYESEAVGFKGSPFFNLVVALETDLPVAALADRLRDIERAHGRVRGEKKFASRTLDIDILTYGDLTGEIDVSQMSEEAQMELAIAASMQTATAETEVALTPEPEMDDADLLRFAVVGACTDIGRQMDQRIGPEPHRR